MTAEDLDGLLQQAIARHRAGALDEALSGYDAVLRARPDHVDALYLSGMIAAQQRRPVDALAAMDRVLAIAPEHPAALGLRANVLHMLGRLDQAVGAYDRVLALNEGNGEAWYNRGNALQALGRAGEALASHDKAVALRPNHIDAIYSQGNALQALGRIDEAVARYDQALALKDDHAEAHSSRGNALLRLGHLDEALASHDRAVTLKPASVDAHYNRAAALVARSQLEAALDSYDRALALKHDHAGALAGRGTALRDLGRLDEALASYDGALALAPRDADTWSNRGILLQSMLRLDESLQSYDRAIELNPGHVGAQWNRANALLLSGDFARGWPAYEWRRRSRAPDSAPPPQGQHVLLRAEQGLGDTIQFARYAPLVQANGARVTLSVQPPLRRVMASLSPSIDVVAAREGDVDIGYPLMSLPLAFGTTLDTIPAPPRYLAGEEALVETWHKRLPPPAKRRIGLVWSGNPNHRNDRNRSLPLETLVPLFDIDAHWVSLQKDVPARDAETLAGLPLLRVELGDFADTAALIDALDLVISVDTSVAHLAGALGKPVWILLPFSPDWRWLVGRDDSPWYPSARLFRQTTPGDWTGVVERVGEALR